MKNRFTKLLTAIFILVTLFGTVYTNAAVKRVIVEDHTGTWCGWCPRGITDMDDMKKLYGNSVFPIAVHNGDPMALPVQQELATTFGLQGYPSGMVDRTVVTVNGKGSVFFDPGEPDFKGGNWGNVAAQILKNEAPLEVDVKYSYEEISRVLSVTVTASVETAINDQTAFNAIVVENGVVGDYANPQWVQSNYYSNRSGYENSPWYNKKSKENLVYDYVLRGMLGGALGDASGIPATLTAGQTYTKSFTFTLPATVKPENIQVYGAVQYFVKTGTNLSKFSFINSNLGVKGVSTTKVSSDDPSIAATAESSNMDKTWKCGNLTTEPMDFTISFTKSSRTPSDWKVSLDKTVVSVAGGSSQNCKVTITPGATHGVGDAIVTISNGKDFNRSFTVTSVSKELERVEIIADKQVDKLYDVASGLTKSVDYKSIYSLTANELVVLKDITSLKTIIVSTGHSGVLDKPSADAIEGAVKAGKKVFLNGAMCASGIALNTISTTLLSTLNVSASQNNILNTIVATSFFTLNGVTGDPISNAMKVGSLKMIFDAAGNGFYLQSMNIIPGKGTVPFLTIDGQALPNVGVRGDVAGTRFVILNINPYVLPDQYRLPMMVRIMDWLENKVSAPDPKILVSVDNIAFGDVKMGTTKESSFNILNVGAGKLVVDSLYFSFGDNFSIKNAPKWPLTIDAGQSVAISISFKPSKVGENYNDKVLFESNDPNSVSGEVSLTGKGVTGTSVDGEEGVEGMFTVKAGPNPFVNNTLISYNLGGNTSQNVNMSIIDSKGATIASLVNEVKTPGSYKLDFSSVNLANGTYFLIGRANGVDLRLSLVINK